MEPSSPIGQKSQNPPREILANFTGNLLKTKTGISKVYFIELPNDVQERFHPSPAKTAAAQRQHEPIKLEGWAAVMANPTAVVTFFVAGTIIIGGVVFAIVRRRFQ